MRFIMALLGIKKRDKVIITNDPVWWRDPARQIQNAGE